jgi:hypothetical protein
MLRTGIITTYLRLRLVADSEEKDYVVKVRTDQIAVIAHSVLLSSSRGGRAVTVSLNCPSFGLNDVHCATTWRITQRTGLLPEISNARRISPLSPGETSATLHALSSADCTPAHG